MVQIFAHTPAQEQEVRELAQEFDANACRRGVTLLDSEIQRGSTLTCELIVTGAEIDEPVLNIVWQGKTSSADEE